jgi:2',3'-cyclic-nucleotide 2'-phosphodiesterase (5'-nucleotidase family)
MMALVLVACATMSYGQALPEHQIGQSVADTFRAAGPSDIGFVASGFLKPVRDGRNLATNLLFPNDELWLVTLTGKQIQAALEISIAFHPQPCPDLLHPSGLDVVFNPQRPSQNRVSQVNVDGKPLEPNKSYKVAMPASLARGGLGYFSVWNFTKAETVLAPSISKLLAGKSVSTSTPRWQSRS